MLKNLFFLLTGFITLAQQPGTVSVTVKDKTTQQPIAYASVLLKNADQLVTGGITADDGTLRIANLTPKNMTSKSSTWAIRPISLPPM